MKRQVKGKVKEIIHLPELNTKEAYYICPKCLRSFTENELYSSEILFCPSCGKPVDVTRLRNKT
jgi:transcription initiation factor IIE alpha subunit